MATKRRYNAAVQRVKGMLELASGLYETSLSHQTRRAAEGVLQTDARLGYYLRLSLLPALLTTLDRRPAPRGDPDRPAS